eukprot:EC715889.1.p1 GENE.EC715889.1~~EC715889.1.p1  ORF type:complete len:205 (+),score=18.84 EC715889.1:53-667(+)
MNTAEFEAEQEDASASFASNCGFIDDVAASHMSVFSTATDLFPIDVLRTFKTTAPQLAPHYCVEAVKSVRTQLQNTMSELRAAQQQAASSETFDNAQFTELSDELGLFSTTLSAFEQVFAREMQSWTKQPPPSLLGLGEVSNRVLSLHRELTTVTNLLHRMAGSYESLLDSARVLADRNMVDTDKLITQLRDSSHLLESYIALS